MINASWLGICDEFERKNIAYSILKLPAKIYYD